jgi:hypothetical protein
MDADNLTPEQEGTVMAAVLPVKVAGVARRLPILPRKAAREWRALWRERLAAETSAEDLGRSFGEAAELTGDVLLDLIVAYDRTGYLGTRDEIDETASDREIRALYDAIAEEAFAPLLPAGLSPQATKALAMLQAVALIEAIALRQVSFIGSRLSTGALVLPNLTSDSPTPKSPSSGRKTRQGARKSDALA